MKANYEKYSEEYIRDSMSLIEYIYSFSKKYNKVDIDTIITEILDAFIGRLLGYEKPNQSKFGWDCANESETKFLEVKKCSLTSKQWNAFFADTSLEKAESFADKNLELALAMMSSSTVDFIVHGHSPKVSESLVKRVIKRKGVGRSLQQISLCSLLKYGFKIKCIEFDKDTVKNLIENKYHCLKVTDDMFD